MIRIGAIAAMAGLIAAAPALATVTYSFQTPADGFVYISPDFIAADRMVSEFLYCETFIGTCGTMGFLPHDTSYFGVASDIVLFERVGPIGTISVNQFADGAFGAVGSYIANNPDMVVTLIVTQSIPEPASWALLIAGFALTGMAMRRRSALALHRD